MKVGYIYDDIFLNHNTGDYHPENRNRLIEIEKSIKDLKDKLILLSPKIAPMEIINLVHPQSHIDLIEIYSNRERAIDGDTITSKGSFIASLNAIGAGLVAIDAILENRIERAFLAIRPPGHHSTRERAMGFCLFNNIAVTAKYAQKVGFKRVFIIDFDVHHGNGTQEIFYQDPTIFYFSSHQALTYPGTGLESEEGIGEGKGFTSNHLLMPESGDRELLEIYYNELPPLIEEFSPDIILVSAGYDLHESDPLASLNVTTEGIAKMVEQILSLTDKPYIFFLEGGYNLNYIGKNVRVTIEKMLKY